MENDAAIQSLFASAEQQLDGDHFTAEVVNKTRVLKYRVIAAIALLALCMAIVVWFFDVPFEIARRKSVV